jgi:hypothetical protein
LEWGQGLKNSSLQQNEKKTCKAFSHVQLKCSKTQEPKTKEFFRRDNHSAMAAPLRAHGYAYARAYATAASRALERAAALDACAHSALEAEIVAADTNNQATSRARVGAWRERLNAWSCEAVTSAERVAVIADDALMRLEDSGECNCDKQTADALLCACERALHCLDAFATRDDARTLLVLPFTEHRLEALCRILARAIEEGDAPLTWLLIQDGRAEPSADDLIRASKNGHAAVVQMLLDDGRADPSAANARGGSACLRVATEEGHADIVEMLLKDRRADPTASDVLGGSACLSWASGQGHATVVQMLLQDRRADPAAADIQGDSACLRWASVSGHSAVVALLLQDRRADPTATSVFGRGSACLHLAYEHGHASVVHLLLEDGRADPVAAGVLTEQEQARAPQSVTRSVTQSVLTRVLGFFE